MSLMKRLRVLYAALTQHWELETCTACGDSWWSDRRTVPSGFCGACEDRRFDQFIRRHEYPKGVTNAR